MKNKYIVIFSKEGLIRFTSHLDMVRLFKRAFRKANIELEYSKGFNPHPKMGFAQPLPLGFSSKEEYIEIETVKEYDHNYIMETLNRELIDGVKVHRVLESNGNNLSAGIYKARYKALTNLDFYKYADEAKSILESFLNQNEIFIKKRNKKTKKFEDKDVKKSIIEMDILESNGLVSFVMTLDTGSKSNLNPELLMKSLVEYSELPLTIFDIDIEREKIYFTENI